MHIRRALRSIAPALALFAVLFGGLAYGTGNMLQLALDPEGAARAHGLASHAMPEHPAHDDFAMRCGEGMPQASATAGEKDPAPLRLLPAHCFFCIDGIAPQPVALASGDDTPGITAPLPAPRRVLEAPLARAPLTDRARGPPALV